MILDIMGTEYRMMEKTKEKDKRLSEANGFVDMWDRAIVIDKKITESEGEEHICNNLIEYKKKIIRHEIIHAFLSEINNKHQDDEELIDTLAIILPKMIKQMQKADAI